MDKDFLKGFKISLGIIFGLSLFLGLVYAVGFHTANEVISGTFLGNYTYLGNVNFSNATVIGLASIPSGAIMAFNLTSCPSGWNNANNIEGRYVVGMPTGGTLGATIGTALSNQENRPTGNHRHYQSIYNSGSGEIISGIGSLTATAQGGANSRNTQGGTLASIPDGTNAPYIQYLYCIKN